MKNFQHLATSWLLLGAAAAHGQVDTLALTAAPAPAAAPVLRAGSLVPGTVFGGGSVAYSRTRSLSIFYDDYDAQVVQQLRAAPAVGVVVRPNLALGLAAEFRGYQLRDFPGPTGRKLGGFVRYYHMVSPRLGITGTLGGGHQRQEEYRTFAGPGYPLEALVAGTGYYLDFTPQLVYFPVPAVGLTLGLGQLTYSNLREQYQPQPAYYDTRVRELHSSFGWRQLQVGGAYYFRPWAKKVAPACIVWARPKPAPPQRGVAAGTVFGGGALGYERTPRPAAEGGSGGTEPTFLYAARAGVFVLPNLAVGLAADFRTDEYPYSDDGPAKGRKLGGFVQYYRMLTPRFGLTGALGGGHLRQDTFREPFYWPGDPNTRSVLQGTGYYLDLTPGLVFFPQPALGLTLNMGQVAYSHRREGPPGWAGYTDREITDFSSRFGLSSLQLGAAYYLRR